MADRDVYTCCLGTIKNGSPCGRQKKRYTAQFQSNHKTLTTEELRGRYTPAEEISREEILRLEFCWQHVSQWELLDELIKSTAANPPTQQQIRANIAFDKDSLPGDREVILRLINIDSTVVFSISDINYAQARIELQVEGKSRVYRPDVMARQRFRSVGARSVDQDGVSDSSNSSMSDDDRGTSVPARQSSSPATSRLTPLLADDLRAAARANRAITRSSVTPSPSTRRTPSRSGSAALRAQNSSQQQGAGMLSDKDPQIQDQIVKVFESMMRHYLTSQASNNGGEGDFAPWRSVNSAVRNTVQGDSGSGEAMGKRYMKEVDSFYKQVQKLAGTLVEYDERRLSSSPARSRGPSQQRSLSAANPSRRRSGPQSSQNAQPVTITESIEFDDLRGVEPPSHSMANEDQQFLMSGAQGDDGDQFETF